VVAELGAEHVERNALACRVAASANANDASESQKRLMSQAEAMRSMWGRGRVTHVLPRGGKAPGAASPRAPARLRRAQTLRRRLPERPRALPAGAFR
jgi:hypothetical protein